MDAETYWTYALIDIHLAARVHIMQEKLADLL